ncbi:Uncharacterised protein [Acinetobacter baumannii]|nr:Uncharacterised protein [Acinetobacter baumannii]
MQVDLKNHHLNGDKSHQPFDGRESFLQILDHFLQINLDW